MSDVTWFQFQDTSVPVAVPDDRDLDVALSIILRDWPRHTTAGDAAPPGHRRIKIERIGRDYVLSSPWLKEPARRKHPVDLVCALIIELVWAYLDRFPDRLCLHGAAVEFAGRLVVFPNRYRAGKSLLSGCLAAAGHRVFTDDILPMRVGSRTRIVSGLATGVPPRLRLPLPENLPPQYSEFLDSAAGQSSEHYRYLSFSADLQAPRNLACPVGSFVFLERAPNTQPGLQPMRQADMLREVVWQNFARAMPSGQILHVLKSLVSATGCFRLTYDDPGDAVELLQAQFAVWPAPSPSIPAYVPPPSSPAAAGPADQDNAAAAGYLVQRPGVHEHASDGEHFLADADGVAIHHLNQTAATVWRLLREPMRLDDIVGVLYHAFPDQARARIEADMTALLDEFRTKRLLVAATPPQPAPEGRDGKDHGRRHARQT